MTGVSNARSLVSVQAVACVSILLRIACRGFVIVFLTAANVVQVSHGHYGGACVGGFLISAVWWANSHAAKMDVPGASFAYGAGAAMGTIAGMAATTWFYA